MATQLQSTKPTGLINAPIKQPSVLPPRPTVLPTPEKVTPTEWKVDDNQLVENRVNNITSQNGLLMQQAETAAKQQANKSGLLNSSMAVGAAQDAVIRAALPIASQDAQTYAAAGQTNATEANKVGMFNTGETNRVGMFNTEQTGINDRFTKELQSKEELTRLSERNDLITSKLDNENRITVTKLQTDNQAMINTNKTAADMYTSTLDNISAIQNDPNIDGVTITATGKTAKQNAIDQQVQLLQGGFAVVGGIADLNLNDLLAFDNQTPNTMASAVNSGVQTEQTVNTANDLAARQDAWAVKYNSIKGRAGEEIALQLAGPRPTA